jgi:hypothetical protein
MIKARNVRPQYRFQFGPELALDGNPATLWHTNWTRRPSRRTPEQDCQLYF